MDNILYSELESNRFSMNIFRGKIEDLKHNFISDLILKNLIDILILRIPTSKLEQLIELDKIGFPYIIADTLVYYSCDLEKINTNSIRNQNLKFHLCNKSNSKDIENLVNKIFPNYTNHYNSNIFLDKSSILEGYKEWAINYLNYDNRIAFIVENETGYIGFITLSFNTEKAESEIILNGVLPEVSGKGVYSDMVRHVQNYLKELKFKKLSISSQIQNQAVQKVWVNEGFNLIQSFNTIHINSLLSKDYEFEILDKEEFLTILNIEKIKYETLSDSEVLSISSASLLKNKFENAIMLNTKVLYIHKLNLKDNFKVKSSLFSFEKTTDYKFLISKLYDKNNQLCSVSYLYFLENR